MKYTMKIYVGEDYKIPFWIKAFNNVKLDSGYFYFKNKKLIEKLNLDKNKVEEVFSGKIEKIDNENRKLSGKIQGLEEKLKKIVSINKQFHSTFEDFLKDREQGSYKEEELDKKITKFYSEIEGIKNNERSLDDKFDGLLDVISDKMSEDEPFPNLLSKDFSLRMISKMNTDNSTKALYIIIYIMKKHLSEKGMSIR